MKRTEAILIGLLIVVLSTMSFAPAMATDGTQGDDGPALLDHATGQVYDSQDPPHTIVLPNATKTLTGHGTTTITGTDICTTGSNAVVCTGTDSKVSSSVIPAGIIVAGSNVVLSKQTGTGTATATVTSIASTDTGTVSATSDPVPIVCTGNMVCSGRTATGSATGTSTGTGTYYATAGSPVAINSTDTRTNTVSMTGVGTNVVPKGNGAGGLIASSLTDDGTTVSTGEKVKLTGNIGVGRDPYTTWMVAIQGQYPLDLRASDGTDVFNLYANARIFYAMNGLSMRGYSDTASTLKWMLDSTTGQGTFANFKTPTISGTIGQILVNAAGATGQAEWRSANVSVSGCSATYHTGTGTGTATDTATGTAWSVTSDPTVTCTGTDTSATLSTTPPLAIASTGTITETVTNTDTTTQTTTNTMTVTATGTASGSTTWTGTVSGTGTGTGSKTMPTTFTDTVAGFVETTGTYTGTRSYTTTFTETATANGTATSTGSQSYTLTGTGTATGTGTGTAAVTDSLASTASATATVTQTRTATSTVTGTRTSTWSTTQFTTVTVTWSMTGTFTSSSTASVTGTPTLTTSATGTASATLTNTHTDTTTSTSTSTSTSTTTGSSTNAATGRVGDNLVISDSLFSRAGTSGVFLGSNLRPASDSGSSLGSPSMRWGSGNFQELYTSGSLGVTSMGFGQVYASNSVSSDGYIQAATYISAADTVSGSNLSAAGHAILDCRIGECPSGQFAKGCLSDGSLDCSTPSGTGTGITCSGTCSNGNWAVFTDSAHITNAGYSPAAVGSCPSGQYASAITTSGPTCSTPSGTGTGVTCSGTCSSPNVAVFADSTHVTNASAAPIWDTARIAAQNTPVAVTYSDRGIVTGAQTITPAWIGAPAITDIVTFGAVFTSSNPGYFETSSTTYVDVLTSSFLVASGTHYLKADAVLILTGSWPCTTRLLLDSTQIGNESYNGTSGTMSQPITAGGETVSSGNHTLHLQVKADSGAYPSCRIETKRASISGIVTPN